MVKKQLIIEKALELFAKHGFASTSVQQITDHCGISKGAFYLSFKSKDELIVALIDSLFMQIIADIDQSVRLSVDKEQLLYGFYLNTFQSFDKHLDFGKILMKEQIQPLNEDLLLKVSEYDSRINESILYLLMKLYGDKLKGNQYDLLICMKGFMKIHLEMYLHYHIKLDIEQLAKSLAEKTSILAQHATTTFLSQETFQMINEPCANKVDKEHIISLMQQTITEVDDSIQTESLEILIEQLKSRSPSLAIIKGLLENITNNPQCKWIVYLIRGHYQL